MNVFFPFDLYASHKNDRFISEVADIFFMNQKVVATFFIKSN
jgi:hypothetical protein